MHRLAFSPRSRHTIAASAWCYLFATAALLPMLPAKALSVTSPAAGAVVPAGEDFAAHLLGDAWDMSDGVDLDTQETSGIINQSFASGVYSGDTTTNNGNLYPLFMGYIGAMNLSHGANTPIDTSHYRFLTYKLRANSPGGASQFTRAAYFQDGSSYTNLTFGETNFAALPANQWAIVTFDLVSNNDGVFQHWLDFPSVRGIRIDPAITSAPGAYASVHFSVDWIRLTPPASAADKTTVQWTDSGYSGTYALSATDADGASYALGSGVSGTSFAADLTPLGPGLYTITVARTDASTAPANSGQFRINNPSRIVLNTPNAKGDQTKNFAAQVVGNPWGPLDAGDFFRTINFQFVPPNASYFTSPAGSFHGRPANADPNWYFNLGGQSIDASVYRSLCVSLEVFGQRSIGGGSVARFFWGNGIGTLTTSEPIVLDSNVNDTVVSNYCIPDLAAYPPDAGAPASGGTWSGSKSFFRFDPDEFTPPGGCNTPDTCHDVRLDSVVLSPFFQAAPGFTFTWSLTDTDNASSNLALYLDRDMIPGNGNEVQIGAVNAANGNGQFVWPGSTSVTYGTYNVLIAANDGKNVAYAYAEGPLVVGARDGIFRNGFESTF